MNRAIENYCNMHPWELETAAKAFALLKLGPDYLAHLIGSKSQVSFVLVPRFDLFAKTKRLDKQVPFHATTVTIYSYSNEPVKAPLDPARSGALKLYAQTLGPKHAPDGVMEITINVIDEDHYHLKYVPHWKPPHDHPSLDNPSIRAAPPFRLDARLLSSRTPVATCHLEIRTQSGSPCSRTGGISGKTYTMGTSGGFEGHEDEAHTHATYESASDV